MRFDLFRRFAGDRRGNVALTFGLVAIPLVFAMGMAIDYGNNARKWSQMNAAADAAALAAATPAMMLQSTSTAQTAAQNMFNAQINGVVSNDTVTNLNVSVTPSSNGLQRTIQVNYTAQLKNIFGGLLGQSTMTVSGSASATGSEPNMNFYLLLDTSPSMEIAGTTAGVTTMLNNTTHQPSAWDSNGNPTAWGCAFACHESNPLPCPYSQGSNHVVIGAINSVSSTSTYSGSTGTDVCSDASSISNAVGASGTPYYTVSGGTYSKNSNPYTGIDNYQLARNLNITLRIDMVANAALQMVNDAVKLQAQNASSSGIQPTYNIGLYTFDNSFKTLYGYKPSWTSLSTLQTNLSSCATAGSSSCPIQPLEVYRENYLTSSSNNSDTDTNIDAALTAFNTSTNSAYIDNPNNVNAQQVLLIVTDGVEDECVSTAVTAGSSASCSGGHRQQAPIAATPTNSSNPVPSTTLCNALKARGVTIGVLYTAYTPLDTPSTSHPSWYDQFIYQFQPNAPSLTGDLVGPAVATCASSSNLFITVPQSNDPNAIANALVQLFEEAQRPHLTQ